jgi:hypothetical protein
MCKICESPLRSEIERKDSAWKADRTIRWARGKGVRINRTILARHRENHMNSDHPPAEDSIAKTPAEGNLGRDMGRTSDDIEFLDAVTGRVYEKLKAGEFDIKIESAFKAIEIKHKISDESRNERLLLEILSEIRADELSGAAKRLTTSS